MNEKDQKEMDAKGYRFFKKITKLTGSETIAKLLLIDVQKLNEDYSAEKINENEWKTAVEKLANKAIPEDTKARLNLHKTVFWLTPSLSMGSHWLAHEVVPLKEDKEGKTVKEFEQIRKKMSSTNKLRKINR